MPYERWTPDNVKPGFEYIKSSDSETDIGFTSFIVFKVVDVNDEQFEVESRGGHRTFQRYDDKTEGIVVGDDGMMYIGQDLVDVIKASDRVEIIE